MLLEDCDGRLLVVKASYRRYWTPPGGVVDENESPKQAAIRETCEEVGLSIGQEEVEFIGVAYRRHNLFRDTYQFVFKARLSKEQVGGIILAESEIAEHDFVTKKQVLMGDRTYSQVVMNWASKAIVQYDEQTVS